MTNTKGALVLLNDIEEFAEKYPFRGAEKLIRKAREAMEKDLGGQFMLSPTKKKSTDVRILQ